jgi:hypothetical protein
MRFPKVITITDAVPKVWRGECSDCNEVPRFDVREYAERWREVHASQCKGFRK